MHVADTHVSHTGWGHGQVDSFMLPYLQAFRHLELSHPDHWFLVQHTQQ